ncbi:MAG: transglutaminase family protein [Pseudonocardiales bacterium]|nr:transglutaminase family protein [Pseudonocardiales bacterium]MBV9031003.1 transglutaminase family protein [Pseudonocardiales bacterium]MBW0011121.1 transglutaminase family protein [Pseudonocardiales bacterium]
MRVSTPEPPRRTIGYTVNAVEHFVALLAGRGPGPEIDVGALAIAAGADPELDVDVWLRELDRLAERVDSLETLIHRLFVEERFTGNTTNYYDPRNSLLDQVLGRRLGLPITLSVVCLEVGRRAGVSLEGVSMPGHFLVRPLATDHYLDAFNGGALLDLAGCEALFRTANQAGPDVPFGRHLLTTAPRRAIFVRILQNLRTAYRDLGRPADLEWVLRMRLALPGVGSQELIELGHTLGRQGRFLEGAKFLESQISQWPQHAELLEYAARSLRAQLN